MFRRQAGDVDTARRRSCQNGAHAMSGGQYGHLAIRPSKVGLVQIFDAGEDISRQRTHVRV